MFLFILSYILATSTSVYSVVADSSDVASATAVSIAVLSAQGQNWDYCLQYLMPFVIIFLNEEAFSLQGLFMWSAIIILMRPYMLFSHDIRSRIFICVDLLWLLYEGFTQIARSRSSLSLK